MALIKCPECGREKVSDTAEMCPDCGYNIRDHYEKIRIENERQIKEKQKKQHEKELAERTKKRLQDPEVKKQTIIYLNEKIVKERNTMLCCAMLSLIFIPLTIWAWKMVEDYAPSIFLVIIAGFTAACSVLGLLFSPLEYQKAKDDLAVAESDLEKYYKEQQERRERETYIAKREAEERQLKHPVCPNCGSRDTHILSTFNRATSLALTGLASSKIGKQYECKHCKHKW